jgi:predicted nuclease of predicted toxin-antitoxin system
MRFIVDAQLPRVLVTGLRELGHDAIHVKSAGSTSDAEITRVADTEDRIVVTKDADFRHTHETGGRPRRLLLVDVGNVRNRELLELVATHHEAISAASTARTSSSSACSTMRARHCRSTHEIRERRETETSLRTGSLDNA